MGEGRERSPPRGPVGTPRLAPQLLARASLKPEHRWMNQPSSNKRSRGASPPASEQLLRLPSPPPNADLYLQAQEADLIYGHDDIAAQVEGRERVVPGGRMLRWGGELPDDEDGVWIDRRVLPSRA